MTSSHLIPKGKLITCVLPKGKAKGVMEQLNKIGQTRINLAFVRGFDIHDQAPQGRLPDQVEKEILTVVCSTQEEAEEVFDFVYEKGELDRLGGGLMYMSSIAGTTAYLLPQDVVEAAE
ncbi:MAG: hypothetical protein KDD61_02625 [Bdellovibrionales bacterium]|nr:hypothetical protein [Bdellovibrionales bacterium]